MCFGISRCDSKTVVLTCFGISRRGSKTVVLTCFGISRTNVQTKRKCASKSQKKNYVFDL